MISQFHGTDSFVHLLSAADFICKIFFKKYDNNKIIYIIIKIFMKIKIKPGVQLK